MGRQLTSARAWMLAAIAVLMGAVAAQAAPGHPYPVAHAARVVHQTNRAHRASLPALVGVGDVPGCLTGSASGLKVLRSYRAKVLRIVIDPNHGASGQALPCVTAAVKSGIRVHLTIEYFNRWSSAQDASYFTRVLGYYARYAWAVSIGNEQELLQGGSSESGARYAAVWRVLEPIVAHRAPHAIRVAGEVSPWGLAFLRAAWAKRLPGAQAIAVHAYTARFGSHLSSFVSWARRTRLPVWVTEGLAGPGAWPNGYRGMQAVPLSRMAGIAVAEAWLS